MKVRRAGDREGNGGSVASVEKKKEKEDVMGIRRERGERVF
jgi:hypothetical protein